MVNTWVGHIDGDHLDVRERIVSPRRRNDLHLAERGRGPRFTRADHPEVVDHETRDERGRTVRTTNEMMSAVEIDIVVDVGTDENLDDMKRNAMTLVKMSGSIIGAGTGMIHSDVRRRIRWTGVSRRKGAKEARNGASDFFWG